MADSSGNQGQPQAQGPQPRRGNPNNHRGGGRSRRARGSRAGDNAPRGDTSSIGPSSAAAPAASGQAGSSASSDAQPSAARAGRGGARARRGGRGGHPGRDVVASQSSMPSRRAFGGRLTTATGNDDSSQPGNATLSGDAPEFVPGQPLAQRTNLPPTRPKEPRPRRLSKSTAPDLPTRIHQDIDNGHYECVICTNEVVRTSNIWSCSLCWTVSHLHCVKKWHKNQMQNPNPEQPQNPDQPRTWRCPGCNSAMAEEPGPHRCWCGKDINSKSIMGLPPHSCGQTCMKPRPRCPHPCNLECHAGPCPPCVLMGPTQACFCGKNTSTKRCSETDYVHGWSCQEVCGDLLPCGEHTCLQTCHSGLCGSCELPVPSTCYCGRASKELPCDRRDDIQESFDFEGRTKMTDESGGGEGEKSFFEGSFKCGSTCGRQYDCGHHSCEKGCHPQDEEPAHCPFSPDVVTSCPCGKTPLDQLLDSPRQTCQDAVPRCDKVCSKIQACDHSCQDKCHTGPCSPCLEKVQIPCRCGRTSTESTCSLGDSERPECARACRAQMNCGRHQCDKVCCASEKRATERKRKKNAAPTPNEDFEADHICLRTCRRALKCGSHACQQLCHKGPCGSCPEAIFDEIGCTCGRTVLQPPQPCGTRPPECRFDCTQERTCNHPMVQHQCHPADQPCPKCPYLVEKRCVCGKSNIKNKQCGLEEVHCGLPCGEKLRCGNHTCTKTCHRPGECEDAAMNGSHCLQPCGKTRTSCNHACSDQCHTPFACEEDKPCQSRTIATCDCQNRKQEVRCGASSSNPFPRPKHLECDDECKRLQRNARLAQALKIDPATHTDTHIPYSDVTMRFFRENISWAQTHEREVRVFAEDASQKRLNFKPMHNAQRAFIHSLAEDFGLDSQSQDPEPLRHVSLFKTPRFVSAPYKTLLQAHMIMKTVQTPAAAVSTTASSPAGYDAVTHFNAFLISSPRFGLTIEEVDQALAAELKSSSGLALSFTTTFLASDEIVVTAAPPRTAASIARTGTGATPTGIENTLKELKPGIQRAARAAELSTNTGSNCVSLCHVDASQKIVRREGDGSSGAAGTGGWSAVVSRAAKRTWGPATVPSPEKRPGSSFVALRKPMLTLKKKETAPQKEEDAVTEEDSTSAVPAATASDVAPWSSRPSTLD